MTYQNDYKLADKLKKEFSGRGENVRGMQASSTSELMKRATMGHDPRENCAEAAFRESYAKRTGKPESNGRRTPAASGYSRSRGNPSSSRSANHNYTKHRTSDNFSKTNKSKRANAYYDDEVAFEKIEPAVEIKAKHKTLSPIFLTLLLALTAVILFLVMQISDIYSAANEISELESELRILEAEADRLELKLEEKNDIREIERIATMELGMTKEDTLQRRYVSLSDGERIEVLETPDEETSAGVMLSSIFSQIGKFFGNED